MTPKTDRLSDTENRLCSLYSGCGYSRFRMGKFEEYDLYSRNKDFLVSDNVITFTDTNGKLMALKPDVTLSIIKNSRDYPDIVQKVFYNEKVYRVAKGSNGFREINQIGLEAFGDIDDYSIFEVVSLAAGTLESISDEYMLDVSNLSVLTDILNEEDISSASKYEILECIGNKNLHEMKELCAVSGVSDKNTELLMKLAQLHGKPETVLPELRKLLPGNPGIGQLERILEPLEGKKTEIDFSVIGDTHYYNGIVFKGFIGGIPDSVVSGGQYDNLMLRMKRKSKAVGFAVYVDLLEELESYTEEYDVDTVVLYDDSSSISEISRKIKSLNAQGLSAIAVKRIPSKLRYRQTVRTESECS